MLVEEQKMTLPLIYALNNSTKKEKAWLINSVKKYNKDRKRVKEVIAFVKNKGGLDYAVSKMLEFQKEALSYLKTAIYFYFSLKKYNLLLHLVF